MQESEHENALKYLEEKREGKCENGCLRYEEQGKSLVWA